MLVRRLPLSLVVLVPVFLLANLLAGAKSYSSKNIKLKVCYRGTLLLTSLFLSVILSVGYHIIFALVTIMDIKATLGWSLLYCFIVHFIVFWNGIICVYLSSTQLGIKIRVLGVVFSMVPVVNLILLIVIIRTTAKECFFELEKEELNEKRKAEELCKTKYPILLVHGVFFRDSKKINYWGRIPGELEKNGATIFYGNQSSAASVVNCGAQLKERIEEVLRETGAEKVNIIAHSKGGLDSRWALTKLGMAPYVASLTTINTPHHGCLFADYLLNYVPKKVQDKVAGTYNLALKKIGEPNPSFFAAVNNLTDSYCKTFNKEVPDPEGVYCQSVGSVMPQSGGGQFPLNLSYMFVKMFDGYNDGLVGEPSFHWGERYMLLKPQKRRGISHADVIDLNRQNIDGFDVREFYVKLVRDLKERGF
ncbi:MAG: triacylglycerol lipase [Clostridia bacterium]|nr:triacylglycerol lipase [Clostridia bacterium]